MAMTTKDITDPKIADPITNAVVNNIMGNLPMKKPHVHCDDCDLSFTSQSVLDAHLQGARHAKQVRSKTIMATLEETKVAFTKDQETNGLTCNVCNVSLNSIQQLQTHLDGNRHKKKAVRGGWIGEEAIQDDSMAATSDRTNITGPIKGALLSCNICNKFFNSQAQYDVHAASRKHMDKVNGSVTRNQNNKRFCPYRKKSKTESSRASRIQSLSNNFVAGDYTTYM